MATVRQEEEIRHANEVRLVGRLAADAQERELPSGDALVVFRLIVARQGGNDKAASTAPVVDTFGCVAWRRDIQRRVTGWSAGDVVEVAGSLRRRFWRAPSGPVSRYEVEVLRARRVHRASV